MMNNTDGGGLSTGLTPEEAKEFHNLFMTSFILFTLVAIGAHFLVWSWRSWLPGADGYAALTDGTLLANAAAMLA